MTEDNYKLLASDPTLYPIAFIERHGQTSAHWELESWQKKERSLCHDMICILLANLEPSQNLEEVMINSLKRKAEENVRSEPPAKLLRIENEPIAGPSTSIDEECVIGVDDSESMYMPCDDYSDEEYNPEDELLSDSRISDFRYIVLEGLSTAAELQNHFAQKWGVVGINKMYDIIDTKEQKFIELKTTVRLNEVLEEYAKNRNTGIHTALITVDLTDNSIDIHHKRDEMPGTSKAYNFIIKRKASMKILGLEDRVHDETSITKMMFKSSYIESTIKTMTDMFLGNIADDFNIEEIDTCGFNIEPITPSILFESLRKPLEEEHSEICSYKGKITPFFYCKSTELTEHNDLYAVDLFIQKIFDSPLLVSGDIELLEAVSKLSNFWLDSTTTNKHFGFINLNKSSDRERLSQNIKDALMIGKKGKIHNSELSDLRQPEREKITHKQYPLWFEKLYSDLSKENSLGECKMGAIEEKSKVKMYKYIGEWLTKFYSEVGRRNVGGLMDQISNFYSRISGTYNTSIGSKTTHSMIACIPIKMNIVKNNVNKRFMTGICFRGPHHTRSATDKSNLLVVEEIESLDSIPANFYRKMTIFKSNGSFFIVRKTAIKKIDGIHLTFVENSLFIASNMIGDIVMRHKQFISEDAFKSLCASHISNSESRNFFIDRVIDACLMAILGNSRDEGYMSMFRKMLMILINERRQQHSFTFDIKGMCSKLNECLIDNPFSMFLQNSLIYMICNM